MSFAWPNRTAVTGAVTFTRGSDTLTLGAGGAVKSDQLAKLTAYGAYEYSDVPLSNGAGESPSNPTLGPLLVTLRLIVVGSVDIVTGATNTNQATGFARNLQWLRDFCAPFSTGDGTYPASWPSPQLAGTWTGNAHLELMLSDATLHHSFTENLPLRVKVPAGGLTFTPDPEDD